MTTTTTTKAYTHVAQILAKPSPHPVTVATEGPSASVAASIGTSGIPMHGTTEASIWRECRDWHVSQGEDRILAGERAWLHINPYGGDCSFLVLTLDPLAVPRASESRRILRLEAPDADGLPEQPSKPGSPGMVTVTSALRAEVHAEHQASYEQHCPHHQSKACKPSKCEHVRLYHVRPGIEYELKCQAPYCGQRFTAARKDAKYHSKACRERARRARSVRGV